MSRITSISEWLLRQSIIWGGLAYLGFYAVFVRSFPEGSAVQRYFNGYWIENVTVALFCIGTAVLVIKLLGLAIQFGSLERTGLATPSAEGESVENTGELLRQVNSGSASLQDSYLVRRLRNALQYVSKRGTADALEEHLRHLQDIDLGRMHHSYASVRIIASTIPILGFLGTVIGITMAIAQLSGSQMEQSLPQVISGLSVAFDTTALALALSMVLLFSKFLVERVEVNLLSTVDQRAEEQLVGRFKQYGSSHDPHMASILRASEQLLAVVDTACQQQTDLLTNSLQETSKKWSKLADHTAETVSTALANGLSRGLKTHSTGLNESVGRFAEQLEQTLIRHAEILNEGLEQHSAVMNDGMQHHAGVLNTGTLKLTEVMEQGATQYVAALAEAYEVHTETLIASETQLANENRQHLSDVEGALGEAVLVASTRQEELVARSEQLLKDMQAALIEAAGTTVAQQQQLIKQGDVLLQVVEATGQVRKLEEALNSNLRSLAGSHHFEQTVMSLSATLQMLSSRLGQPSPQATEIALSSVDDTEAGEPTSYAA
ncbi:MotA/TolQ/ExbB proton channel family protein [Adhaeretor mobilis]|uniref:MotA/TolQ/ExbB proton channel family protein n=1 Tax=Adhaeretor mobilis TaxID=1930276 RepID=A0A517MY96_9BACT|nr:MotA/TolQ/ExbB proton channel family protein [Adhaeretor mobilis]